MEQQHPPVMLLPVAGAAADSTTTGNNGMPPPTRRRGPRKRRPPKQRAKRPPQAQQLKVTFRKIEDMERYGTAAQVMDMIRSMVNRANQDIHKFSLPIQLDEESIERLILAEQLAAEREAAQLESKEETEQQEEGTAEEEEPKQEGSIAKEEEDPKQEEDVPEEKEATKETLPEDSGDAAASDPITPPELAAAPKYASVVKGPDAELPPGSCIRARALYVVPPRKSRRRGIKSGCAYLVLTAPAPTVMSEEEAAEMTQIERSRVTAIGRLQLLTAVEALTKIAEDDVKSNNNSYAGCVVAASVNGKAWKGNYRDNREGTIEETGDYQQFQLKCKREAEERQSRPRPTPGGMLDDLKDENGQQLAAIVMHLRAKRRQEAKRRKASMRKNAPGGKDVKGDKKKRENQRNTKRRSKRAAGRNVRRPGYNNSASG